MVRFAIQKMHDSYSHVPMYTQKCVLSHGGRMRHLRPERAAGHQWAALRAGCLRRCHRLLCWTTGRSPGDSREWLPACPVQGSGSALSQAPPASTPSQGTHFAGNTIIIYQAAAYTAQRTPEQLQRSICMNAGTIKFEAGQDPPLQG
jgi:hypothetical protein